MAYTGYGSLDNTSSPEGTKYNWATGTYDRIPGYGGTAVAGAPAGTSAGSFGPPQAYQLGGQPQADVQLQAAMTKMGQTNPFQVAAQGASGVAGQQSTQQGATNIDQAAGLRQGANQVMNTAFDPQKALYDRTAQQLQDQVRVGEATRGITMSPYGAGVENQAMSNFNIDWQNNQLGRQTQGLGAAGTANQQAGAIGQAGVGQTVAGGQLPASTFEQGQQQYQTSIQDWLAYLSQGSSGTNTASNVPQLVPPPSTITFGPAYNNQFNNPPSY